MAILDFKLDERLFWSLTPAQFSAINKRFEEQVNRSYYGHCITTSVLANVNRDPTKRSKPFQPKDFMPVMRAPKRRSTKTSVAEMRSYFEAFVVPSVTAFNKAKERHKAENGG